MIGFKMTKLSQYLYLGPARPLLTLILIQEIMHELSKYLLDLGKLQKCQA